MTANWTQDTENALAELKQFQRRTVDRVYDELYAPGSSGRYLIADEVGLGKTLVARGVIAKAIPRLLAEGKRVDIVYLCSSTELARENIRKLQIGKADGSAFDSRLTMLPLHLERLAQNESRVNFVAFTPGTSLELREGLGQASERVLLYQMVRSAWDLPNTVSYKRIFAGGAGFDRFVERIDAFDQEVHKDASKKFEDLLKTKGSDVKGRLDQLARGFPSKLKSVTADQSKERTRIIGELRMILAEVCVDLLEPDIIILDEFQRFSHLLEADEENQLAQQLLRYLDAKLLLLSATPYKMYTTVNETGTDDHYQDFVRTVRFLEEPTNPVQPFEEVLTPYQNAIRGATLGSGVAPIRQAAAQLSLRLRKVMVRNERLASTPDRNGMLCTTEMSCEVQTADLMSYVSFQNAVDHLEAGAAMEYWRSSPYPLNFLDDGYKLKTALGKAVDDSKSRMSLARKLRSRQEALLSWNALSRYHLSDLGNPRMRRLAFSLFDKDCAHLMLWLPPSMPHYALRGPFWDEKQNQPRSITKRLIFSAWRVAPRAIAAMLSYEAERRIHGTSKQLKDAGARGGLNFSRDKTGRLTGMPVFALLYPSLVLAKALDPLKFARELALELQCPIAKVPADKVVQRIRDELETVTFRHLTNAPADGPVDERWYWAAPLFLDRKLEPTATTDWFKQPNLEEDWTRPLNDDESPAAASEDDDLSDGANKHWASHVNEARAYVGVSDFSGSDELDIRLFGRKPDDLAEVIAEMAVAGPAVCAYRSLLKVVGASPQRATEATKSLKLRTAAARTAWALRGLFNQPDVAAILRRIDELRSDEEPATDTPYWRQVLSYCIDGGLQAVLEEYLHILSARQGPSDASLDDRIADTADEFMAAIELRTAQIGIDVLTLNDSGRTLERTSETLRAHFALRYGDERAQDGSIVTRATSVRKAFNSPFWPFVLATTAVGQEGLDFHCYCHAVVHWNLPSNPVDLEQREGRVHRFKGHAVRRNVAATYGEAILSEDLSHEGWVDDWTRLFVRATEHRTDNSDIVPYWIFTEGPAKIERHVFELPLGQEAQHFQKLRGDLTIYRMVFGQARQDDLLAHLAATLSEEQLKEVQEAARVDLGV